MKTLAIILAIVVFSSLVSVTVYGHQSGCHRWHSCPSDSGSYTCGDKGYCSECQDNQYCKAGEPRSSSESSSSSQSQSSSSSKSSSSSTTKPQTKTSLCKGTALCIVGKVSKIIDGDTLKINSYTIRLSLTNTPEKNQYGFKEATSFTSKLCPVDSTVTIDQDDGQPLDQYKRIVGKVICSGKILNSELLYNGYANIMTQYCKKSEFASESWAKRFGC